MSEKTEDDSKIVQFANIDMKTRLTIKRSSPHCQHRNVVVDENRRTVECAKCGTLLDPFMVLYGYACEERTFVHARLERDKMKTEMVELKRQERNIKARIRRLEKDGGRDD